MSSLKTGALAGSSSNSSSARLSSTTHRVQFPSLDDPLTHQVFQSVVKSRKSWKAIRGGELVWPPELEAALIEGLERYEPEDSRETRILGRYPHRNRFISEYIFRKTSVKRTAKQVGSRLQQLRGTATEEKLLKLLSPCAPTPTSWRAPSPSDRSDAESSSGDVTDSSVTPVDANFPAGEPLRSIIVIYVMRRPAAKKPLCNPIDEDYTGDHVFKPTPYPRPFHCIDPTIAFIGPSKLSAESLFSVHIRGVTVFKETTSLTCLGPVPGRSQDEVLLYSTPLIPGFWERISESADPTQYSIFQDVVRDKPEEPVSPSTVFSAVYKFRYREPKPARLPPD